MVAVKKTTLSGENEAEFVFEDTDTALSFFEVLRQKYLRVFNYKKIFEENVTVVFEVPSPAWDQLQIELVKI